MKCMICGAEMEEPLHCKCAPVCINCCQEKKCPWIIGCYRGSSSPDNQKIIEGIPQN